MLSEMRTGSGGEKIVPFRKLISDLAAYQKISRAYTIAD